MKTLAILFTLFYFLNALAVAPYGIQGQNQATTLYSNVHKFPNNQVTNLGGINALVETGNKNILSNPSFEHSTFSTNWSSTGTGSFFEDVGTVIDGKKSAGFLLVSQTINLTQDSNVYAGQFADGVQGLVSVRVKANGGATGIKVCSRQAAVTSTTNCVDVVANGKWGLYKVPVILGSSSNGISIASTGNVTSAIYVDDAFVGAASLTQNMNACNDVSCETEFSAKISLAGAISSENLDWLNTCTVSPVGTFTCSYNVGIFAVEPNCTITVDGAANGVVVKTAASSSSQLVYNTTAAAGGTPTSYAVEVICQKQGADFTAAKQLSNGNTYSSTNSDTDWASCNLTGANFVGFGTSVPTPNLQCKRQGGDLLIKGTFNAGTTPTAVEARLALPTWNGVQLVSAGSSIIPSLQFAGNLVSNTASTTFFANYSLIEPSVSYLTFSQQSSTTNGITKANGNAIATSGLLFSVNARIPIEGWQNSNIIIGQFNGLESCTDTLECTDTFSASVTSTGSIVAGSENVDWISGSCTFGTGYLCNFNTGIFTVAPNCTVTPSDTSGGLSLLSSTTSSSVTPIFISRTDAGSTNVATNFRIICQKAGVDYNGKTAKAVRQDGMVYTEDFTNLGKQSLTANGYQKLPGGLIMQWMTITGTNISGTLPTAFPTGVLWVSGSANNASVSAIAPCYWGVASATTTTITRSCATSAIDAKFLVIGY